MSLVGAGMKSNPGVAAKTFETLAAEGINIEMISTVGHPDLAASCARPQVEQAVQALHAAFDLDASTV